MCIARTRTQMFSEYLRGLAPEERRRIESAELRYLAKRAMRWRRAERDFAAGMAGIDERIPFYARRNN